MSPPQSLTYTPKRNFVLRTPTSKLAYRCINASDLISPSIPILLPKEILAACYPDADALDLAAILPLTDVLDDNEDEDPASLASSFARNISQFASLLLSPDLLHSSSPSADSKSNRKDPCLKEILYRTIPADIWAIVSSAAILKYSQDTETLRITFDGTEPPSSDEMGCEFGSWKEDAKISALEIGVSDSIDLATVFKAKPYKAVLWLLNWFQGAHGDTIESINVNLPMKIQASSKTELETMLSAIVLDDDCVMLAQVYPKLKSLHWTGDARLLRKLLPSVASQNVEQITMASHLSIFGAQWVLRQLSTSKLHTLELSTLAADYRPRLQPPFALPYLDTLKIGTSVPLDALMEQIEMPCLRSVSLVLDDGDKETGHSLEKRVGYMPLELMYSFFSDPNVQSERLLFVDVQCGIEPERVDHVKGLVAQRVAPDAIVKVC